MHLQTRFVFRLECEETANEHAHGSYEDCLALAARRLPRVSELCIVRIV